LLEFSYSLHNKSLLHTNLTVPLSGYLYNTTTLCFCRARGWNCYLLFILHIQYQILESRLLETANTKSNRSNTNSMLQITIRISIRIKFFNFFRLLAIFLILKIVRVRVTVCNIIKVTFSLILFRFIKKVAIMNNDLLIFYLYLLVIS